MTNERPFVPNKFPTMPSAGHRLCIIGEAPGVDEETVLEPFVGSSGKLLRGTLGQFGLAAEQCLICNVTGYRPPGNNIEAFDWDGPEISSGIARLRSDIEAYKPNAILSLGRTPMRVLRPDLCYPGKKGMVIPIGNWRGSVTSSMLGYKSVFCYHPAYILRAWSDIAYFTHDVGRAVEQSKYPELRLALRSGILDPTLDQVLRFLQRLRESHTTASIDIEGYPDHTGITCMSICPTPYDGIVIPFWVRGRHYWSDTEEVIIWQALSEYLADPTCEKKCHNGFYEHFVYLWKHRCLLSGWHHDTMLKFWELYPELEKNLGVVNSFTTLEPYYKDDRKSQDSLVKLEYNFKDSAVTDEADNSLEVSLQKYPLSYTHYQFNIRCSRPFAYLNLRGCRIDTAKLEDHKRKKAEELVGLQQQINDQVLAAAIQADVLTRKRKSDPWTFNVKGECVNWLLYDHLGYKPSQRHGRCHDEEALLRYFEKHQNPLLRQVIQAVRARTRLQDIAKLVCDSDGRLRTSLDLVGTNTGRSSSRHAMSMRPSGDDDGSWENTGTNLQNVTEDLRDVFVPDSDAYDFWQFDLRGADAWTVAADLATLGHSTMLEDLLAGIKPAKVLVALLNAFRAGTNPAIINNLSRGDLKILVDAIDTSKGWEYFASKIVQHATNYDAKPETCSARVFDESDGAVNLSVKDAGVFQFLYKLRYKPEVRNADIKARLSRDGFLQTACGIRRKFFGIRSRRDIDDEIVRQASAFEPQANTTYCTNAALLNLWNDPSNRQSTGWLHCDPLLQIHDALAGQNHSSIRGWAHRKLQSYFNTELTVHGVKILIPADGGWGTSWKDSKNALLK